MRHIRAPFANDYPSAIVAAFWADLAFDPASARIWTLPLTDPAGGATNGCVVAWEGLRLGTNENSSASFQVEVHSNGLVRILHGPVTGVDEPGAQAVVGVQNGIHGWSYSAFATNHFAEGRALRLWSTAGFDPTIGDSDGDGTVDGLEWWYSLPRPGRFTFRRSMASPDPLDFDNDGLNNRQEYDLGLDACWYDSDGDGLPDGWEVAYGLDPLNTTTNIGVISLVEPPLCRSTLNWGATTDLSTGAPATGIVLVSDTESTNSTVFVDWTVAALTSYTQAVSEKNCRIGTGTIEIGGIVKVGLDVTNNDGTSGPDGDMHDAGDNLARYLPGYVGDRPVIKWDEDAEKLIPQHLQIRVETLGGSWTNAKISLWSVTGANTPGWCTNTREPSDDPAEAEIKANWFPEDFSLSETEFLNEVYLPLGEDVTVAVADLYCRDYGGKCRVKVDLFGEGDTYVTRNIYIPRDDDNDGIADCWETTEVAAWNTAYGTHIATNLDFITRFLPTEPRDPDGGGYRAAHLTEGDGLSPFDEYRGYSLPGTGSAGGKPHLRFSPARKEMVIQAAVATTNGVALLSTNEVAAAMEDMRGVFERDLGIDLHWYLGPPLPRIAYEGILSEQIPGKHAAEEPHAFPLLHSTSGKVRRMVFTHRIPRSKDRVVLGIAWKAHRLALVDRTRIGEERWDVDCARWFHQRHGTTVDDILLSVAAHEAGHLAGCTGDIRIPEESPAFRIRSRVGGQGTWQVSRKRVGSEVLLQLTDSVGGTESYAIYKEDLVTLADLAASVNEPFRLFHAEVASGQAGADASRLMVLPENVESLTYGCATSNWHRASLEASVNGVMTYNNYNPAVWRSPAFDNVASTATNGPSAVLFKIEVGSVNVE